MLWANEESVGQLCRCNACDSKLIDVTPVPGGLVEIICRACGHIAWHQTSVVDVRDPARV